jgi:predicted nuclease of predicted toxin-antitoxin system
MRVLLDEQLPRHLAREIAAHDISTVQQRGWAGLKNGELLRVAADAGFEVLVTADRNLQFQQNLSQSRLGIILLLSPQVTPLKISVRSCPICSPLFRRASRGGCYA